MEGGWPPSNSERELKSFARARPNRWRNLSGRRWTGWLVYHTRRLDENTPRSPGQDMGLVRARTTYASPTATPATDDRQPLPPHSSQQGLAHQPAAGDNA